MRQITRLTDPTKEAWTPQEICPWVGATIDGADGTFSANDVAILGELIPDARELVEDYLQQTLLSCTWTLQLDAEDLLDADGSELVEIALPMPPVTAISAVRWIDDEDVSTVWAPTNYRAITGPNPRLTLRTGITWPTDLRDYNCIQIDTANGYGADGKDIPGLVRICLRELITFWYRNRGEGYVVNRVSGGNTEVPPQVDKILSRLAMLRIPVTG